MIQTYRNLHLPLRLPRKPSLQVKLHLEQQPWICEFSNLILLLIWMLTAQTAPILCTKQFDLFLCSGLLAFLSSIF